jgi:hypothetical protein
MDMRTIRHLLALLILAAPAMSFAQIAVGVSIRIAPPAIPVYAQPICPGDGYLWVPGYWAWDDVDGDYYWVPGTWVLAPEVGFLWTPGWWGWRDGGFFWNEGFWGPTVGFYGGIYYGFGYFGHGFYGGRWDHGHFFYNTTVMNVNTTVIRNVYNERVENITNVNRVSYNGGQGGIEARPTPEEEAAAHERHIPPVREQVDHASAARANPQLHAKANGGRPPIAATERPGNFTHSMAPSGEAGAARAAVHPRDLPPIARPEPPNSGDAKADAKYQKQQDKLIAKQEKDREKLEQKQEAEHQKEMNDAERQRMEQTHQQETQRMVQRHAAQMQVLEAQRPQPRASRPR